MWSAIYTFTPKGLLIADIRARIYAQVLNTSPEGQCAKLVTNINSLLIEDFLAYKIGRKLS